MKQCHVCSAPCRGTCATCQTPLCAKHKPAGSRATCAFCPRGSRVSSTAAQARPAAPKGVGRARTSTPLADLTRAEQLAWIAERRKRVQQKQARERAYLDRRAARGTHTPTDDAYEADAILESDLLQALDLLSVCLQGGRAARTSLLR